MTRHTVRLIAPYRYFQDSLWSDVLCIAFSSFDLAASTGVTLARDVFVQI